MAKLDSEKVPMRKKEVLHILFCALANSHDLRIDDVDMDKGVDGQDQLILTSIDRHDQKQVWIIDEKSVLEHDAEHLDEEEYEELPKPGYP